MTRKTGMKAVKPLDGADEDLAALAEQWVDQNWYLPPGGDQSWRDREAQRLFGKDGKKRINDDDGRARIEEAGPMADGGTGAYAPGFRRPRNILIPVSLVACGVVLAGAIMVPQILPSGFWGPREPKPLPGTPAHMINVVAVEANTPPSLTYGGGADPDKSKVARMPLPQQVEQAGAPAKSDRKAALPRLSPPVIVRQEREGDKPAIRAAKAQPARALAPGKRGAKPLPPIGEAYFASHAPAVAETPVADLPPIGQAYFESHSPSAD